jgi:hypothetical protein
MLVPDTETAIQSLIMVAKSITPEQKAKKREYFAHQSAKYLLPKWLSSSSQQGSRQQQLQLTIPDSYAPAAGLHATEAIRMLATVFEFPTSEENVLMSMMNNVENIVRADASTLNSLPLDRRTKELVYTFFGSKTRMGASQDSFQNHEFDDTRLPDHTMGPSPPFSLPPQEQEMEERPFVDFVRSANSRFYNNNTWTPPRVPNSSRLGQYPPRTMQGQGLVNQTNFPVQDFEYQDWGQENSVRFQPYPPPHRQYHQPPMQQDPQPYYMQQQQQQQQNFQPQYHHRSYPPQSVHRQYMGSGRVTRQPMTANYPPQAHSVSGRRFTMLAPQSQQSHNYHGGYSNVRSGYNVAPPFRENRFQQQPMGNPPPHTRNPPSYNYNNNSWNMQRR